MVKQRGPDELSLGKRAGEAAAAAHGQVSFRTRRLEAPLLWALTLFTVWCAAVLNPGDSTVWLLSLYAGTLAAWARTSPPRRQREMLLRGGLLLLGAFMLQASSETGGPDGPYFVWPFIVTAIYSLLLARRWVFMLWAIALAEFVASRVFANAVPAWQLMMVQAGIAVVLAFIAAEYGRTTNELDELADVARRDRNSRLYNEAGFFANGGELFEDCRRRKRPFSLVLLNSADLREVAELSGKKAANHLFAQLVQRIAQAAPADGLAARTDAVEFALALPGMTAVRAAALLHQKLGQPPKVEVALKGSRLTVMLDSVVAEAGADATSLEDMYDRLRPKLQKRTGETPTPPSDVHSTWQGMLESDSVIPHHARPTMPMDYGAAQR